MSHQLRSIADAENWILAPEAVEGDAERFLVVDRERRSRQDHTDHRWIVGRKFVVGNDFTISGEFAHATTDELGCLRAEVKDNDFFLHER